MCDAPAVEPIAVEPIAVEPDRASGALRASYDAVAADYALQFADELRRKPYDRALLTALVEEAPPGLPLADVGCGPGQVAAFLHALGRQVVGIDLSDGMVEQARRLHPGPDFRQGSMLALDLADGTLGGVAALYSVIHVPPPERPRAFAEFARVLAPGGLLLLAFHRGDEVRHLDEWYGRQVDVDFHFLDVDEVARLLAGAGLTVQATLLRRPHDGEVDTERAYILARRDGGAVRDA
jgi:SAM-dependent methyltransferase